VTSALSHYLETIGDKLRLDFSSKREVINELKAHLEDRLEELKEAGLSEEEAANTCMKLLGSAKLVARQIYEAHSQGTWRQALLASMPHLLFGLLFALNWWQYLGWLLIMLSLVLGTVIYGWCHGKPTWLFPWLGYSLLPVVAAGLLLLYLPAGWSWLAIFLYIPVALWLLCSITIRTIKRDWLYSSLMLLPIPIIIGWFLVIESGFSFSEFGLYALYDYAPWIGLSFLALGISVAIFIRLRQRWLRVALLFTSGLLTLTMVACYANGRLHLSAFLLLILVMAGLISGPALLERKLRSGEQRPTA